MEEVLYIQKLQSYFGEERSIRSGSSHECDFSVYVGQEKFDDLPDFITEHSYNSGFLNFRLSDASVLSDISKMASMDIGLNIDEQIHSRFMARLHFKLSGDAKLPLTYNAHMLGIMAMDIYRLYDRKYRFDKRFNDMIYCYEQCLIENSLWRDIEKVIADFTKE